MELRSYGFTELRKLDGMMLRADVGWSYGTTDLRADRNQVPVIQTTYLLLVNHILTTA